MPWGELRCSECLKASRYSKIMLRFELGSMAKDGEVVSLCKCGHHESLTTANHHCDGVSTFRALETARQRAG